MKLTLDKRRQLEVKLDQARWYVLRHHVFYGQLMMHLRDYIVEWIPTAGTDGRRIVWGADFLDKLTEQETRYVLIHEILHCAWGHIWRFPNLISYDKEGKEVKTKDEKANIACDHAINLHLNEALGLNGQKLDIKMPEKGLADEKFKGLCEEEIYRLIKTPPPNYTDLGSIIEELLGDKQDGESDGNDNLKDEWTRKIIAAAQAAKAAGQGNLPADLQRYLDDALAVKIDWRQECSHFVRSCVSLKNDWTRSSRRNSWQKVIIRAVSRMGT